MKTQVKGKKTTLRHPRIRILITILLLLVWTIAATIASQYVMGYLLVFIIGKEAFFLPVWTAFYSALSYILTLALVLATPILFCKKKGISRRDLGLEGLPTWTDIGLAPIAYIVGSIAAAGLALLFSIFPWFNATENQAVSFSLFVMGWDRIVAFLTLVVVAPIAEEVIFRGWLYSKIREKTSDVFSEITSVILSSVLVSLAFGIVHLQLNVGVNVFAISLVLCALREITGTIYAGIFTHMIKNGVAFWLLYIIGI